MLTPRVEIVHTPPGMGHVKWMAKRMAKLAGEGAHSYPIRQLATRITHNVPSKSPTRELLELYKWVRNEVRYRHDPVGLELLQKPEVTVKERAGDCDDMTTLLGALCGALGHPWRFRTVGPSPEDQAHVQLQAHDKKRWLDLDPVLEPAPLTTAWSDAPGRFGAFAVGADHLFDSEGTMLRGPTTAAERALWYSSLGGARRLRGERNFAGPTSATDRELWEFIPYFPPVPPPPYGGSQPPMPGAYPPVDTRYRSPDAPGFMNGKPFSVVYDLPAGSVASESLSGFDGFEVMHPTLGAGWLKRVGRKIKKGAKKVGRGIKKGVKTVVQPVAQVAHDVTHKGPIAKLHKGVQSVAKKIPVLAPFVQLQEDVFQPLTEGVLAKTGAIKSKKKIPNLKTLKRSLPAAASAAATSSGGNVKVPPQAARVAAVAKQAKGKPALKLLPKPAAKKKKAPAKKPAAPPKDAWKQPQPELRRKYPASARMLFDPGSKRFRVFVPKAALNGFGGIVPTITFTLGAAPSTPAQVQAAKAAAQKLESALKTFIDKNKRPPAIALPAVTNFQKAEGTLKQDGLYGTNTKAAAEYYLGRKLPAHAPGLKSDLTWKAPSSSAPKPAPAPAPTPAPKPAPVVVVKPAPAPAPKPKPKPAPVVVVKPAKPANALPVPSGYVEVGQESNNPGLPPVGFEPVGKDTTQPAWTQLPPDEVAILKDHAYKPSPDATYTVVPNWQPGDPLPSQQFPTYPSAAPNNPPSPNWVPAGQLVPHAPAPPIPTVIDASGTPRPVTDFPGHPSTTVDANGQVVHYGPVMDYAPIGGDDNRTMVLLALAWWYYRGRKRAA